MRIITSTQWILALLLFFTSNFETQAQTLDATFSSPLTNQCAGSLFTLNATTTTYQGYTWTIEGPNNFSSTIAGSSSALNLTEPGTYNVSLSVTDGVITTNNSVSGYLTVKPIPTVNSIPDQIKCSGMYSDTVNFTGNMPNTTYIWSRTNTTISVTPIGPTGAGNIPSFLTDNPVLTQISSIFSVTPSLNGCTGSPTNFTITVLPRPISTVSTTSVCVGGTVTTTPNTGGNWTMTNPTAATITSSGIVNVETPSTTQSTILRYTETTSGCFRDHVLTVNPRPFITSPASICVGSTGQLSPSTGGAWVSNNSSIASVSIGGLMSGLATGTVNFTFTNTTTTCSNSTSPVTVNSLPVATLNTTSICQGQGATATPATGGTWSVVTGTGVAITGGGVITSTTSATGPARFRFTQTSTGCQAITDDLTINPLPTVTAPASVCMGSTAQLTPIAGGTWVSSNPSIASITNAGLVTGLVTGTVNFTYTIFETGCARTTNNIMVNPLPVLSVPTAFCDGTTVQLLPSTGGTWTSVGVAATVTNNGTATGLISGFVTFTYVNTVTGCSATSSPVEVYGLQQVSMPTTLLCVNSTIQLSPNSGGSWVSSNPSIASVTNAGLVTGLASGTVNFTFTNTTTGCAGTTYNLTVSPLPIVTLSSNTVCVNSTAQLTPSTSGTWVSNNPSIATISSSGLVTGTAEGIASFSFTSTATGCSTTSSNLTVTANATVNPIPDQIVCAGDSTSPITFSSSAQQYNWTNSNINIGLEPSGTGNIAAFTAINTALSNQIATITVTPVSSNCNATPTTFTLTVIPLPTINPIADQIVCNNQATQAIVFSSSNPNAVYAWNQTNVSIGLPNNGFENISSFQAQNTSGIPQIDTITVTPSLNGCLGTAINFTITVNPSATIDPIPDQIVCAGDSTTPITFSGSAQQYSWSHDNIAIGLAGYGTGNIAAFTATNTALINQVATITVTPISGSCNSTPTTFTITVKPIPTVFTPPNQTLCNNDSTLAINFSGPINGTDYNWTNSNSSIGCAASGTGNIPSFQVQNLTSGSQIANFVVIPSLNGCNGYTDTLSITVNPFSTVNPIPDQIVCVGDSITPITFSGSAQQYNWTNDNTLIGLATSGTGNISGFIATNPTATNQISIITVTPINGSCNSTPTTFTITVKPMPTVDTPQNQTRCHNDSTLAINFSGAINGTDYNWTNSNSSIGFAASGTGDIPSFQVQNTTFGSQIANFVVTPNLNGCLGSAINFNITVLPLPIVNAGNDTLLCAGQSYSPVASGSPLSTYLWSNNVFNGVPFIPTSTITLTLVIDLNGCIASDDVTLTVVSIPISSISTFDGEDSLACDGMLSVLVTDGTAPYSYTWTNGASNYTTSAIQDLCSGTYSLSVIDANGCSATNSAVINDTLIPIIVGDTLIFTDNIYQDSTIIGADTSDWIENCTFDYSLVTGATIDSYIDSGDSIIVTWIVALSTGSTVSVDATYYMSPGTTGVYDLTLQLYCSAKSGPKFLVASSRLYYEASTIGLETHSLNTIYLYPNPTNSTLSISGINSDFSYKISDLQGKLLKQGFNDEQIEIENLPAGTYVIGISTDDMVKQLRFVKL